MYRMVKIKLVGYYIPERKPEDAIDATYSGDAVVDRDDMVV